MNPPQTSAAACCEMVPLVQAEFDAELDAAQAAALAAHRAHCPVCQLATRQLAATRELMRDALDEPLPEAVRHRVLARLEAARPQPQPEPEPHPQPHPQPHLQPGRLSAPWRWRMPAFGFGLGAACAAALSLLLLAPAQQSLTEQVVAGHIRALQPGHLEDVPSTDQHTVKPWFDGRIDFAPPVKDLKAAGFPLKGGRLDYLDGRAVAALVYQHDKHVIDLFVWPQKGGGAGERTERDGYNVEHWSRNGMTFWAVSDLEGRLLRDFAETWQRTP